jgi:hypothetical protein
MSGRRLGALPSLPEPGDGCVNQGDVAFRLLKHIRAAPLMDVCGEAFRHRIEFLNAYKTF